jgi:hypothetical protein
MPVQPVKVDPAYLDREGVWRAVVDHSPYPLMAGSKGYEALMGGLPLYPFFRSVWAHDGQATDREAHRLLHHEPFIEASRKLFRAEIVRPSSLIVNVMGPTDDGGSHVDAPTFRGIRRDIPIWLSVLMGMSGLFDRWAVRVAGALTWFYENSDGEFEYWPLGVDSPSAVERGPFGNVALVADNDLMTHRVRRIGDPDLFDRNVELTLSSAIHAVGGGDWEIRDGHTLLATLRAEDVRVSLLWKAVTFLDDEAAWVYDNHEDDLELNTIVATFGADLARRGVGVREPSDPLDDPEWAEVLHAAYMRTP